MHTLELPNQNRTDDDQIKAFASEEERIIITKDRDFLDSHLLKNDPQKLILIKTGNISNDELLQIFQINLALIIELIVKSNLVEVGFDEIICKSWFCQAFLKPYLLSFAFEAFLTPYSCLIQIRKYAELENHSDLLDAFKEILVKTKRMLHEISTFDPLYLN